MGHSFLRTAKVCPLQITDLVRHFKSLIKMELLGSCAQTVLTIELN